MRRSRILFILHLPPPVHGASISNRNLINSGIIRDNYEMDLINFQFASSMANLKKFTFLKVFKSFVYALKIIRKISTHRPDLVYYTLSPSGYAFYRDAIYVSIIKLFHVRIVFHLHGKGVKKSTEKSGLKKYIYQQVFKNCHVICLTNNLVKDIEDVSSAVPYIVPYGIPIHTNSGNKKLHTKDSTAQILFLSNYVENKGILVLIDALSLLKEKGFTFHARLVGAPTDLSMLDVVHYIKTKDLENHIEVVGPKFNDEKHIEYENSDIFVFPTFYFNEAQPLVNLEAMQHSLPIVTTTEGGIPETVINNETGFIIEPRNVLQLAEKLALLIEDRSLRIDMGEKGYERFINNYTLDHFITNIDKTFRQILVSSHVTIPSH